MPTTVDIESQRMFLGSTPVRKIYQGTSLLGMRIAELFANGEQGVWYDPSDFSTLFQGAAGTTPVTAVEQPVGLMMDKSKGLVLGPELVTNGTFDTNVNGWTAFDGISSITWVAGGFANVKMLTDTGSGAIQDLTLSSGWAKVSVRARKVGTSGNTYIQIYGKSAFATSLSGVTVTSQSFNTYDFIVPATNGGFRVYLKVEFSGATLEVDSVSVRELSGNHAYQMTTTSRPVLSARVNQYLATETLATQNITTLAAQYRLRFEGTGTITLSGTATGVYSAGSHLITCTAGTLTSTVSGSVTKADLRVANDGVNLPPYQRVNTDTDYDTVGFPMYLRCDGVDDGMVTNSINFTGTDKLTVCAGVRKLSDAIGVIAELSDIWINSGAFAIYDSSGDVASGRTLGMGVGPDSIVSVPEVLSPTTYVATGSISRDSGAATLRRNSTTVGSISTAGPGNFGNYPLYIGCRGGTTLPFNGRFYGMVIVSRLLSAGELSSSERYINGLTKAY